MSKTDTCDILDRVVHEAQCRLGNDPKCAGGLATKLNDIKLELIDSIDHEILKIILRKKPDIPIVINDMEMTLRKF